MTDVVIVGAGPVGLLAALALGKRGISVVLLEKEPALPDDRRAGGFHAPTVDMFEDLGLLEDLLSIGYKCPSVRMIDPVTGLDAKLNMNVLGGHVGNPYMLTCTQPQVSKTTLRHIKTLANVDVRFEHDVIDIVQSDDAANVQVKTASGMQTIATKWAIGCDGAHSIVRQKAGIGFPGYSLPEKFFIVETKHQFGDVLDDYNLLIDGADWRLVIRLNEEDGTGFLWRFVRGIAPEDLENTEFSQSFMEETVHKAAPAPDLKFINHYMYHVHQKVADTYRAGRVLLAGDAAHINNPLGGQGLNAGIHDVVNLVDKLCAVIAGDRSADCLDVYSRQRRLTNIEYIQRVSIENRAAMQETDLQKRHTLAERFQHLETNEEARLAYMKRFAMVESLEYAENVA